MDKKIIRKNMLEIRNRFSQQERAEKSAMMWQHFMQTNQYHKADIIFTYVSMNTEAETTPFFEKIWKDNKKIAVPMTEQNRQMCFAYLDKLEELTELQWGIPEPNKQNSVIAEPTENSIFIVPALAVDKMGNRIGYGGGYYDTYFSKYQYGLKMAFVFSEQQLEKIETLLITDIALDGVITEKGVFLY